LDLAAGFEINYRLWKSFSSLWCTTVVRAGGGVGWWGKSLPINQVNSLLKESATFYSTDLPCFLRVTASQRECEMRTI
jgi:hypothetical protein